MPPVIKKESKAKAAAKPEVNPWTVHAVPLADLAVDELLNIREQTPALQQHIETLAEQIAEKGILQPLTGHRLNGTVDVDDGRCRLMAIKLAMEAHGVVIDEVPMLLDDVPDEIDRLAGMMHHNQGMPLTVLEKSKVYGMLAERGVSRPEIARMVGCTEADVSNALVLYNAPEAIHEQISSGAISATEAKNTIRKYGPEAAVHRIEAKIEERAVKPRTRRQRGSEPPDRARARSAANTAIGYCNAVLQLPADKRNVIDAIEALENVHFELSQMLKEWNGVDP